MQKDTTKTNNLKFKPIRNYILLEQIECPDCEIIISDMDCEKMKNCKVGRLLEEASYQSDNNRIVINSGTGVWFDDDSAKNMNIDGENYYLVPGANIIGIYDESVVDKANEKDVAGCAQGKMESLSHDSVQDSDCCGTCNKTSEKIIEENEPQPDINFWGNSCANPENRLDCCPQFYQINSENFECKFYEDKIKFNGYNGEFIRTEKCRSKHKDEKDVAYSGKYCSTLNGDKCPHCLSHTPKTDDTVGPYYTCEIYNEILKYAEYDINDNEYLSLIRSEKCIQKHGLQQK
jgi:co-chaperonin GroES (HSP10)